MSSKLAEEMLGRLKGHGWLPSYEADAMKKVIDETSAQVAIVTHMIEMYKDDPPEVMKAKLGKPQTAARLFTYQASAERNKRCALAYLNHRMNKVRDLYWETVEVPAACATRLSQHERDFHSGYQQLISSYMADVTGGGREIRLDTDLVPPKMLHMTVRLVKEQEKSPADSSSSSAAAGGSGAAAAAASDNSTVYTDSGPIALKKNGAAHGRRTDFDLLIRQGVLQHTATQ